MPDNKSLINAELEAINQVVESYTKDMKKANEDITLQAKAMKEKADAELLDKQQKKEKAFYNEIANLRAAGLLNDEQTYEYIISRQKIANAEAAKEKLESELEILKTVQEGRKAAQKELLKQSTPDYTTEDERQKKQLETEQAIQKEIQAAKEAGNVKELKLHQRKLRDSKAEFERNKKAEARKQKKLEEGVDGKESAGEKLANEWKDAWAEAKDKADENGYGASKSLLDNIKEVGKAIGEGLNKINKTIDSYIAQRKTIDARTQGVSSLSEISKNLENVAFSPLLKAEDLYANVNELVGQGIVSNVEQKAMLMTMKDGIVATFDVTSNSLKRMIKLQQNDSTAARMGMESYLTKFLNTYVENTEYLQQTFDTVADSLLEASALLGQGNANASAEFEYIVQKWLGTLSGLGLSDQTAQSMAETIGKLGAGNVEALTDDMGVLFTMAASSIGMDIGEKLNDGLDADTTNSLLKAVVEYLQSINDNTEGNVVKSQLAKTFGVSVSDLIAVSNLSASDIKTVFNDRLSTAQMYTKLQQDFDELPQRLGIATMLENLTDNMVYQTAAGIANSPIMYTMWKVTDLIQTASGGINIPALSVVGNMIDLETTVENLMKLGITGASMLGQIGGIVNGLGSGVKGSLLLSGLNIAEGNTALTSFGNKLSGGGGRVSGFDNSAAAYIGNTSGLDYQNSALNQAYGDAQKQLDQKLDEYEDPMIKYLEETVHFNDNLNKITERLGVLVLAQGYTATGDATLTSLSKTYTSVSSIVDNTDNQTLEEFNTAIGNTSYSGDTNSIANYLAEMNFSSKFDSLLESVQSIQKKVTLTTPTSTYNNKEDEVVGLTNGHVLDDFAAY